MQAAIMLSISSLLAVGYDPKNNKSVSKPGMDFIGIWTGKSVKTFVCPPNHVNKGFCHFMIQVVGF